MSHHLLYIGPLRPETLPLLEALNSAEQALFVLPAASSEHWEEVKAIFPRADQQIIKVAEASGEHPYYEFNLPEFNASQPASGLHTLYPGLELTESSPQPLVGVDVLLSEQESQPVKTIVVEQPELVWPLLQALVALPSYNQVSQLWLRVGTVPLYQGMPSAEEILNWCQEQGFELRVTYDEDPDMPLLRLSRHPFYERWQEETKRSAKLAKQLKIAQQEAEQQLAKQATEQAESLTALEQREATSQKRLKDSEEQLHQQQNKYEQLQQKYKKLEQQLAEQQKSANKSTDDRAVKEKEAQQAELQKQLNQLTEERDTLKKQLNQSLKSSQQHQKEHEEIKQQLEETQQKFVTLEQQYQDAEHAGKKAQKKIEEGSETVKSLEAELKKQHEETETKLAETQQMLNEKDTTIRQLSGQMDALQHSNERFGQLESKLESLFSEQRTYIQQTTNVLGQHVTRSARQQRDEQAMINYLQYGQRPITTQLSPSYVTALLEHYDTHNPDVVVVFGAAETTELLAQRIINARAEVSRIGKSDHRQETHKEVTVSHDDLPQTIVSIEHNKAACESLKESLNNKRLSPAVNVVNAPWVECQSVNEPVALFYAADTTLQRLNQWLPENARILVIVGETLPQAGHSREIVLPLLLQQLRTQQLDIVMEGNHFPQESELVAQWGELLQTRQRSAEWLTLCTTYSLRVEG